MSAWLLYAATWLQLVAWLQASWEHGCAIISMLDPWSCRCYHTSWCAAARAAAAC